MIETPIFTAKQGQQQNTDACTAKTLSQREIEVLSLLALGCTDDEIACILCIECNTASKHIQNIKAKTKIGRRTLLAFYAYSKGFVGSEEVMHAIRQERTAKKQ
jgi:Response regulator containing a CheY-like receiver domain and an HTH DNA-binding domain